MIDKSKYLSYVKEMVKSEEGQKDLKYLRKHYYKVAAAFMIIGFLFVSSVDSFPDNSKLSIIMALIGVVSIIIGFALFIRIYNVRKRLKGLYRENIFKYLLEGYEYTFDENEVIDMDIYRDSQFPYKENSRVQGGDTLVINLNNSSEKPVNFVIGDLNITSNHNNKSNSSVYRGSFGYIEFAQNFKCVLCVNTSYDMGAKLENVELESIEFNEIFKISSNDQVEARYILTPDTMEYFIKLTKRVKGLKATFVGNRLYLGFNKDLFELNFLENNIEYVFEGLYDDLSLIISIVNEINRNDKIFKLEK